jgi:hypothetical protein
VDNSKETLREHFNEAREGNREIFEEARAQGSQLLLVPMRCMLNNTSHTVELLKDCSAIMIDTVSDLAELNRGMRERMRMGRGEAPQRDAESDTEDQRTVH